MSEVVLTSDELDEFVRYRVESVLISSCSTHTNRILHMLSDEEWLKPACNTTVRRDGWVDKPISVFPPGYRRICPDCVELLFDVEVTDE